MVNKRRETRFPIATKVWEHLRSSDKRFFANDNIVKELVELSSSGDAIREQLIDEATRAFEDVLYTMIIDTENDPNSMDTPRRLAKMYINELMGGRYVREPKVTAFPNSNHGGDARSEQMHGNMYHFNNLLVVQSPFKSVCSHHHQVVDGTAYIGIIPGEQVIGLSKYTRLVQHVAARGTLQEELTTAIADILEEKSSTSDLAVVVYGRHGCCEHRGIGVPNSQTATAEMRGLFMSDGTLRKEFYDHVQMMRRESHK